MVNKVNYKRFLIISLGVSIIIFTSGLLLGIGLDNTKVNELVYNIDQNEISTESYSVEKEFLNVFGGDKCILSDPRVKELSGEIEKIGRLLNKYESTNIFEQSEFDYLKRKYFLLETKAYSLFYSLKKECSYNYTTILFFYDINDDNSIRQGYVLDALVNLNPRTHILSFDRLFEEDPTLETVRIHYNITKAPTLIINDRIKRENLINLEDLMKLTNEENY